MKKLLSMVSNTNRRSGILRPTAKRAAGLVAFLLAWTIGAYAGERITVEITSHLGGYHAVVVIEGGAEHFGQLNHWSASVSDSSGQLLFRLAREIPFDTPFPALVLADSLGTGMLLDAFDGIVEFIDGRGEVLRRWRPFAGEFPSYERVLKCAAAGRRAAFLVSDPAAPPARVYAMDVEGMLQATVELPVHQAGEIFLSSDGRLIVAGGSRVDEGITLSTSILSWEGAVLDTVAMDFRLADVSGDGARVFLADTRAALVLDLPTGTHRRPWAEDRSEAIITALCAYGDGLALASQRVSYQGGPPLYDLTDVVVLGSRGRILLEKHIPGESLRPAHLDAAAPGLRVNVGETTTSVFPDR